ncbi:MAG: hypothetical protein K2L18_08420, partial [Acetatifactor sp.]|nr:hypothetical protein [Acetatifactor sp.]
VLVKPHLEYLDELQGQAATPFGVVSFQYAPYGKVEENAGSWDLALEEAEKSAGSICCQVTLPKGMSGTFCFPDGSRQLLTEGVNRIYFKRRFRGDI